MQAKMHTEADTNLRKSGAVTLTGFVHSYAEKFAAEGAAKSIYGVMQSPMISR